MKIKGYKHGMRYTKFYRIWAGMVSRVTYKGDTNFKRYGGRGITVCNRWRKFENFMEDMHSTYKENLSLERINNEGNYEPSNCKWATRFEQNNNKRTSSFIEYKGNKKTIKEWAVELKLPYKTLFSRIKYYGWTIEKAIETPKLRSIKI